MSSATAVRTTLPLPATIAAFPRGVAWIAHPTGARPTRKTTSMLLTVTSPATPAWGARAPVTDKIVWTWTSAATESGPVTQVEQPDATTDGAAGRTGVTTGPGGLLELAVSGLLHPARPATATVATTLATRLIGLLPPAADHGPGGDREPASHRESSPIPTSMIGAACLVPRLPHAQTHSPTPAPEIDELAESGLVPVWSWRPNGSPVLVRTPSGTELDVADPALAAELGAGVRVIKQNRGVFDTMPLSLVTTQALAGLGGLARTELAAGRFRPNILVDASGVDSSDADRPLRWP